MAEEETGLATRDTDGIVRAPLELEGEERVGEVVEVAPPLYSSEDIQLVREAYGRYISVLGERERPKVPLTYDELQTHEQRAWNEAVLF